MNVGLLSGAVYAVPRGTERIHHDGFWQRLAGCASDPMYRGFFRGEFWKKIKNALWRGTGLQASSDSLGWVEGRRWCARQSESGYDHNTGAHAAKCVAVSGFREPPVYAIFTQIPNRNQKPLIVASFGFTILQTTLLTCVDGVISIATVGIGVNVAALTGQRGCTASTHRLNASRHTSVNPRNALGTVMHYRACELFNAVSTLVYMCTNPLSTWGGNALLAPSHSSEVPALFPRYIYMPRPDRVSTG
ncbi:hypothetical protein K438DRAFT_1750383 [Mycena galopus ATCC 62051]|nr:hypothetical protein K438DRAFT_1750383 [Mycena galopus ATCC 62051]